MCGLCVDRPPGEGYGRWKAIFDDAAELRSEAGESDYQVFRYAHDPERIVHLSLWESETRARAFFESPRRVELRANAGVLAPEFHYLQELESGTLDPSGRAGST
jgi:quinol monooxygenase YgiN